MGSLTAIVGRSVYLDVNIFIYAVEGFPTADVKIKSLFARIDAGELHAWTSEL